MLPVSAAVVVSVAPRFEGDGVVVLQLFACKLPGVVHLLFSRLNTGGVLNWIEGMRQGDFFFRDAARRLVLNLAGDGCNCQTVGWLWSPQHGAELFDCLMVVMVVHTLYMYYGDIEGLIWGACAAQMLRQYLLQLQVYLWYYYQVTRMTHGGKPGCALLNAVASQMFAGNRRFCFLCVYVLRVLHGVGGYTWLHQEY